MAEEIIAQTQIDPTVTVPVGAVPPTVEPPKVEPKKEDDDKFAARFAALARKERMVNQKIQEAKKSEAELNAYRQARELAKIDPDKALETLGLNFTDLAQRKITGKAPEKDPLKELSTKQDEIDRKLKEIGDRELSQKREQEKRTFINRIEDSAKANKEKFELVNHFGKEAIDLAYNVIENYFLETREKEGEGRVLSNDDALALVEDYYFDKLKPALSLNKLKALIQTPTSQDIELGKETKTLLNEHTTHQPPKAAFLPDDEQSKKVMASLLKFTP